MAVQDIIISIGGDAENLKKAVGSANKNLSNLRDGINKNAGKFAKYGAAATAAGVAVTAALVKEGLAAVDAQAKLSKQLNTTTASIATLERAGQLAGVSMTQIGAAGRTLDKQIGDASRGVAKASENFNRLGLDFNNLAKVPLDQRINLINEAISKNIPIAEQAAVASELYGQKQAAAIRGIDGSTIERATKEAILFGQALSDIDAAKIENANDSISTISNAMDGVTKQLALQFAPVIEAIGKEFLGTAEDVGGFNNVVESAFNDAVTAAGFVMDAIHGIDVVIRELANAAVAGFAVLSGNAAANAERIAQVFDALPGVDLSESIENIREFKTNSAIIVQEAANEMAAILDEPMPSEGLKKWVDDARKASEEAAKAAAETRVKVEPEEAAVTSADQKQIDALKKQYSTEQELLYEKLAKEQEIIDEARANGQIDTDEWYLLQLQAKQGYEDGLTEIERQGSEARLKIAEAEAQARKQALGDMLSNLSALMGSENKKQFEIGKKAAMAQTAISTMEGAQKAFTGMVGAFPGPVGIALGVAAAGAAIAAGNVRLQAIRSQQFGGAANTSQNAAAGGVVSPPSGGGGGGEQGVSKSITVRGIDQNSLFTGGQLIDLINSAVENGYQLRVQQ